MRTGCTSSSRSRSLSLAAVVLTTLALLSPVARADVSQQAIDRAQAYLQTREMGKNILSFVHFGADYKGHSYSGRATVVDEDGKTLTDKFALVYRFNWEDDGVTDVAFLCNSSGRIYEVQMMKSNGVLQRPFAVADMTIQVLGDAILKAMGNDLKEKDRADLKRLVDSADSHGLLVAYLRLGQILK